VITEIQQPAPVDGFPAVFALGSHGPTSVTVEGRLEVPERSGTRILGETPLSSELPAWKSKSNCQEDRGT